MITLAIAWNVVGVKLGQLLLSLSILVVLHEFGHFITARWFGCRVERFFLFFDPWFALFKKKVGETVYGIGWLPLGGYVKISGMIDESMDKDQLALPPQPYEFRSKPAWQRLIIMLGGVTMNVIVAFVIYSMILIVWGERTIPNESLKYGVSIQDSILYDMGFRDGDKIAAADGEAIEDFGDVVKRVLVSKNVTVVRNGENVTMNLPENFIGELVERKRNSNPLILPRIPVLVDEVPDTARAYKSGLRPGDQVVAINGQATPFYDDFRKTMATHKSDSVQVSVLRGTDTALITTMADEEGRIGFLAVQDYEKLQKAGILRYELKKYSFFESIPGGVRLAGEQLKFYVDQFKLILSPKTGAYKGVGGFKSMGSIFPAQWDWESFWNITAFFSIVLAFMNLLPIPALDGGHVLFTLFEMISGRKPNQKFLEYAQVVGMVILFGLMIYANGNDWFGWNRGR